MERWTTPLGGWCGSWPSARDDAQNEDPQDQDTQDQDTGNAETGLEGNVYTNAEYGWSIEFDKEVGTVEEVDESGNPGPGITVGLVNLDDLDLVDEESFRFSGSILVHGRGTEDPEECLENLEDDFTRIGREVWVDFAPARGLDPPQTADDAVGNIYTSTFTPTQGEPGIDLVHYLECRAVEGDTLAIQLLVSESYYKDLLPAIEDLLAGINTSGAAGRDTDREEDQDERPPATPTSLLRRPSPPSLPH